MITIAIANHKGGVGKTTTAVTLAAAAPIFGRSALLIDLDPQAQCATALGVDRTPGLYHALRDRASWQSTTVPARPLDARAGPQSSTARATLHLLPGTRATTARLQDELVGDPWGHLALAEFLDTLPPYQFDITILDCPPTLGRLNVAALVAADLIIVPTTCNYLGLESVGQYLSELNDAKARRGGPTATVAAILPTFYDTRTNASREAYNVLLDDFGDLVARPIPRATIAERIVEQGRTIWELAPRSPVGVAYARLAEWLYRHIRTLPTGQAL